MNKRPRLERLHLDVALGTVRQQARELAILRDDFRAALPPVEAAHLVGVSTGCECVTVFADSATWCTRLRYCAPMLEAVAKTSSGQRPRLEFRVMPPAFRSPPSRRSPLSPDAVATLRSAARTVQDPALADALRRLADA